MNEIYQTYVSEPTINGEYQIAKYDIMKNGYVPIKGEKYQSEKIAIQRAHELNKYEDVELKYDYEIEINELSASFGFLGIEEEINIYNDLKAKNSLLNENENQRLNEADKKIIAWNSRVNDMINTYLRLTNRGIAGLTSPYKYFLKGSIQ